VALDTSIFGHTKYSGTIVINVYFMQLFLQFEHRKVATEKVREQYTDRAEKKSKLFQTGGICFLDLQKFRKTVKNRLFSFPWWGYRARKFSMWDSFDLYPT